MVLINVVYFKGKWAEKFDERDTRKKTFYNCNDKSQAKKVEKMSIQKEFRYYSDKELQMVELPYQKDSMSAIIILPNRNKNINEFISEMCDEKIQILIKKMNSGNEIALALPRFELEFESGLNNVLRKLGISDAFNENLADFYGLIEQKNIENIYINIVKQKAYLRVDEEGTEAVAVTQITIEENDPHEEEPKIIIPFIVDRRFFS